MSQPRPPDHSTFPDQQSPWIRLGGSAGPATAAARPAADSTSRASAAVSVPASLASWTYGSSRALAYHGAQLDPGSFGSGRPAITPGQGAPNPSAPAACRAASSR